MDHICGGAVMCRPCQLLAEAERTRMECWTAIQRESLNGSAGDEPERKTAAAKVKASTARRIRLVGQLRGKYMLTRKGQNAKAARERANALAFMDRGTK